MISSGTTMPEAVPPPVRTVSNVTLMATQGALGVRGLGAALAGGVVVAGAALAVFGASLDTAGLFFAT